MDALEALEEHTETFSRRSRRPTWQGFGRGEGEGPRGRRRGAREDGMADLMMEALFAAGMAPGGRGIHRRAAGPQSRTGIGAFLRDALESPMFHPGMMMGGPGGIPFGRGIREAMAGASQAGIPPGLLLSDRDFTADDYEALLKLDERVENRKGASSSDIEALPTHIAKGPSRGAPAPSTGPAAAVQENKDDDDDVVRCPICLEDVVSGQVMRLLPCAHRFHRDCIDSWLQQKASCPICLGSL